MKAKTFLKPAVIVVVTHMPSMCFTVKRVKEEERETLFPGMRAATTEKNNLRKNQSERDEATDV